MTRSSDLNAAACAETAALSPQAAAAHLPERAPLREELRETIKLALPIALTQLGQVAMMTTDLALLGHLGDKVLAAAALAHTVFFAAFMFGMGVVSAVAPLASQAFGAREPRMVRRALRVGLWAASLVGIPLTTAQFYGFEILTALGQQPEAATLAARYLFGLAWCLVPAWWFIALRGFMSAVNRPEPGLWITLAAIPANATVGYTLIYGHFGFPKLDLLGAGIATTIVSIGMCAAAIWVCYAQRPFRKYQVLGHLWRLDWALLKQLFVIGLPISGAFLLEFGLFAGAAQMAGWLGTIALAAHQIALQYASLIFMIPVGISMAATVRVGHAVGRRDPVGARAAGFTAIGVAAAFMATMTVLLVLTRDILPSLFIGVDAPGAAETAALAAKLLLLGATFSIADGIQSVGAGALRGLNDTRVPLIFAAVGFWIIGFPSSYVFGFPLDFGVRGIWIGFTLGLGLYAVLLVTRFHLLTKRGYLPAIAQPGGVTTVPILH